MDITTPPKRIAKKNVLAGVLVLTAVILLSFRTIFKNLNGADILGAIHGISPYVIPLCSLMLLAYSFFEGVNMHRALKLAGCRINLWQSWKYAIAGFFYSGITPSSSGGQPMQIYYMYQDRVQISHGLFAVIMQLFGHEGAIVILGLTGFFAMHKKIPQSADHLKFLIFLGLTLNLLYFLFLMVVLFTRKGIEIVSNILGTIVKKFNRKGNSKLAGKMFSILDDYRYVSDYLEKDKIIAWKAILTGILQFVSLFSIQALIYLGFGLSEYNYFQIILLQSVVFISVGFIPIPGSTGISEGMAFLLYQSIYPSVFLGSAVLLGRCFSMYFGIILYGIILAVDRALKARRLVFH